jgi:hypothetical protein
MRHLFDGTVQCALETTGARTLSVVETMTHSLYSTLNKFLMMW